MVEMVQLPPKIGTDGYGDSGAPYFPSFKAVITMVGDNVEEVATKYNNEVDEIFGIINQLKVMDVLPYDGKDLNTLRYTSNYHGINMSNGPYPSSTGFVTVLDYAPAGVCAQYFYDDARIEEWVRGFHNGSWTYWRHENGWEEVEKHNNDAEAHKPRGIKYLASPLATDVITTPDNWVTVNYKKNRQLVDANKGVAAMFVGDEGGLILSSASNPVGNFVQGGVGGKHPGKWFDFISDALFLNGKPFGGGGDVEKHNKDPEAHAPVGIKHLTVPVAGDVITNSGGWVTVNYKKPGQLVDGGRGVAAMFVGDEGGLVLSSASSPVGNYMLGGVGGKHPGKWFDFMSDALYLNGKPIGGGGGGVVDTIVLECQYDTRSDGLVTLTAPSGWKQYGYWSALRTYNVGSTPVKACRLVFKNVTETSVGFFTLWVNGGSYGVTHGGNLLCARKVVTTVEFIKWEDMTDEEKRDHGVARWEDGKLVYDKPERGGYDKITETLPPMPLKGSFGAFLPGKRGVQTIVNYFTDVYVGDTLCELYDMGEYTNCHSNWLPYLEVKNGKVVFEPSLQDRKEITLTKLYGNYGGVLSSLKTLMMSAMADSSESNTKELQERYLELMDKRKSVIKAIDNAVTEEELLKIDISVEETPEMVGRFCIDCGTRLILNNGRLECPQCGRIYYE